MHKYIGSIVACLSYTVVPILAAAEKPVDGLPRIPTVAEGATHDTMDPAHMQWMAGQIPHGRFLLCNNGSHLSQWDDSESYYAGLIKFLKNVDTDPF